MPTCSKCKFNCDTVKHYKEKCIQNMTFYGDELCRYCFEMQTSKYWEYSAYLTLMKRYAEQHCPLFIKDQFALSIEFIDKPK